MTDRFEDLSDIYSRLGGHAVFTERQQQPRGTVRSDREVDHDVRTLVAQMRDRERFRTTLSDEDLVVVVRGFYTGRSDRAVAADLGVTVDTVFRARMALHLFDDADASPELDAVARKLRDGADRRAIAAALDVSLATVDRVTRLVAARDAARRVNYQYTTEFADLLDGSAASTDLDRQRRNDRLALTDAYDT